jgi:hypothetical protein
MLGRIRRCSKTRKRYYVVENDPLKAPIATQESGAARQAEPRDGHRRRDVRLVPPTPPSMAADRSIVSFRQPSAPFVDVIRATDRRRVRATARRNLSVRRRIFCDLVFFLIRTIGTPLGAGFTWEGDS